MARTMMTLDRLTDRLVEVFGNEEMTKEYQQECHQSICFGWDGNGLSPISRVAYLDAFGKEMVEQAEMVAQAIVEDKRNKFENSQYREFSKLADEHLLKGQPAPTAGSFVWALDSGLKCEGGLPHAISNMEFRVYDRDENEPEPEPRLCKVTKVFNLTEEEFDPISEMKSAEVLHEIVKLLGEHDSGSCSDDVTDEELNECQFNFSKLDWKQRTFYTLGVAVVCGNRWFIIDTEGFDYTRYILVPLAWETMFKKVLTAIRERNNERRQEEQERQECEYNERLAAYRAKCEKWAHLMEPIEPYTKAKEEAYAVLREVEKKLSEQKVYGTKNRKALYPNEYKAADQAERKEHNVRRKNILAMVQAAFPDVKFSLTINKGWGGDWNLTWYDGPTKEEFEERTDLDLFVTYHDCFDGMTDCAYTTNEEHTDFAKKYMGGVAGDVRRDREMSKELEERLKAEVRAIAPDVTDDDRYDWTREQIQAIAERYGISEFSLAKYGGLEYLSTIVHRIFCNTSFCEKQAEPTPPVPPTGTDDETTNNINNSKIKEDKTMANKKNSKNETNNAAQQPVTNQYTLVTYQTKKGGTGSYVMGFKTEAEAKALADNACKTVGVTWRYNDKGEKVYALSMGTRYVQVAQDLCAALNAGDKAAVSKAIAQTHDIYAAAVSAGKAEREAKQAEKKAAADKAKAEKLEKLKKENGLYSMDEIAAKLRKLLPEGTANVEDIKKILAA